MGFRAVGVQGLLLKSSAELVAATRAEGPATAGGPDAQSAGRHQGNVEGLGPTS